MRQQRTIQRDWSEARLQVYLRGESGNKRCKLISCTCGDIKIIIMRYSGFQNSTLKKISVLLRSGYKIIWKNNGNAITKGCWIRRIHRKERVYLK